MRRVAALLCTLLLCAGCSEPPQKEIDHAQGAIDAARAAGADRYASVELAEATSALQQSHDAVNQRDYRLALSRALDASQRAQEAARQAAEGGARARSEAEAAMHTVATALEDLESRLDASSTRAPDGDLKAARKALSDGRRALQEAGAAASGGDYLKARAVLKGITETITAQIRATEDGTRPRPARRRR